MNTHVLAYAKLNLSLDVIGRRDDGFHEIRSIVQTIDLADRIAIADGPGIEVSCDPPIEGTNIVEHALERLLEHKGCSTGARVRIEKHIPMGAGLGGGSSDAAAVLAALNPSVPPVLPEAELVNVAEQVGSDVPLFLSGGCLSLSGRGRPERSLPTRNEAFIVLVPNLHCSTRDIYEAWSPHADRQPRPVLGHNDLYRAALHVYPELETYDRIVRELGGDFSGMTGSGSAFYAAFCDHAKARDAYERLAGESTDCRIYYCRATHNGSGQEREAHEDRD